MSTDQIVDAPAHTIVDLVRMSKAYRDRNFPRHRSETVSSELSDVAIAEFGEKMYPEQFRGMPRHRKADSTPKHRLWEIEQN